MFDNFNNYCRTNSSSKNGSNFYGYYKDSYGNYYNAKDAYQRDQSDDKFKQQSRQSYEQWYQNMKEKQKENQTKYQNEHQNKQRAYRNYQDFRADFESQFRYTKKALFL